jgi:hypothetical protein
MRCGWFSILNHSSMRAGSASPAARHSCWWKPQATPDRPALRPIAVVHDGASTLEVINLTLQTWTRDTRSPLGALQDLLPRKAAAARIAQDPLADLARRALVEATIVGAGEPAPNVAQLEQSCDAAGLSTLAAALRRMSVTRDAPAVMATAYVASETLASLSWV